MEGEEVNCEMRSSRIALLLRTVAATIDGKLKCITPLFRGAHRNNRSSQLFIAFTSTVNLSRSWCLGWAKNLPRPQWDFFPCPATTASAAAAAAAGVGDPVLLLTKSGGIFLGGG